MDHQQKESICTIKQQAYHRGYIDGYRRGIEDSKSGKADSSIVPGLEQPIQILNLSTRPFNSLDRSGSRTIGDIVSLDKEGIGRIRGLGSKGAHEGAHTLWNYGIRHSAWNFWL